MNVEKYWAYVVGLFILCLTFFLVFSIEGEIQIAKSAFVNGYEEVMLPGSRIDHWQKINTTESR